MKSLLPLMAALVVSACASTPAPPLERGALQTEEILIAEADIRPQQSRQIQVEVPAPCKVRIPERPAWPLDDPALAGKDLYVHGRAALAEIELRRAYEARLEAALRVCTRAPPK